MSNKFPPEVIYAIFSRLPIKSLARFRCVCKQWLKLINDPYLHTIHIKEEPTPIIFQQLPPLHPYNTTKQCKVSFLRAIQGATNAQKDPVFEFFYKGPSVRTREELVLGSCNGLTLVRYKRDHGHGTFLLAIINPVNKQRHDLPPIKNIRSSSMNLFGPLEATGIGFDESTNTLKTVFVVLKNPVWSRGVKALRKELRTMVHYPGMGSWRKIAQTPAYPISGEGVFGDGRLHWLVNLLEWHRLEDGRKIVWFDVRNEVFGLTDAPTPKRGCWTDYRLVDLNGEVGFAYIGSCIELWRLKQKGYWVLHCWFDLSLIMPQDNVEVVGCWNKDGDILLTTDGGRRLFVYTLKTGVLRGVDRGDQCEADVRMYRSSLFSVRGIDTMVQSIKANIK